MRLLNTDSLELREFAENEIPPYAILSHTWEREEVSFQDMQNDSANSKAGYQKMAGSCKEALSRDLFYIWIDTCCIDKSSSAELTEAINSMYRWYQEARVCLVYLSDVPYEDILSEGSCFSNSRWFTRGWTLQELIAPSVVVFYSNDWRELGMKALRDRTTHEVMRKLSTITGVDSDVLAGKNPHSTSIAKRMSWASSRVTTRKEDMAYCLMGLFGVNMPLLYGEGDRAFLRLQEEIMKASDDHSLFAWRDASVRASNDRRLFEKKLIHSRQLLMRGLLAKWPKEFIHSSNVIPFSSDHTNTPHSISNRGLRIKLVLLPGFGGDIYTAVLNCADQKQRSGPLAIHLRRLSPPKGDSFARVFPNELFPIIRVCGFNTGDEIQARTLYVKENPENPQVAFMHDWEIPHVYLFSISSVISAGYHLSAAYPPNHWDRDLVDGGILRLPSKPFGVAGVLLFEAIPGEDLSQILPFMVVVAINSNFCFSIRIEAGNDLRETYERSVSILEGGIAGSTNSEEHRTFHSYKPQDMLHLGNHLVQASIEKIGHENTNTACSRIGLTIHIDIDSNSSLD